ncbi:hypothetical protein D3C78_1868240 [compost metagenome]
MAIQVNTPEIIIADLPLRIKHIKRATIVSTKNDFFWRSVKKQPITGNIIYVATIFLLA